MRNNEAPNETARKINACTSRLILLEYYLTLSGAARIFHTVSRGGAVW